MTVVGNPHNVTKAEVGLGLVPNTNFTDDVAASLAHIATTTGNPHQVTKEEVGLGLVPNVDCTNASNITTGMLPSSVLPPVAITSTHVITSEVEMLALTVQEGDVAVRTDLNRSYINSTGDNLSMADWQELLTPTDTILSVNGQTGTVVLTTTNVAEGTNLYYTEARVSANTDVTLNTANRHSHTNKAILDATTAAFTVEQANDISVNNAKVGITTEQAASIVSADAHIATITGNPHQVTKAEVGLSNVPNVDFTSPVAANTAHRNTITGNPHQVTKAEVGLGLVPNTDFTSDVASALAHIATITGNPHQVTKAEVGLSEVPNHDFTAEVALNTAKIGITPEQAAAIVANTTHAAIITGNPHQVTKAEVGLGLVPNVDLTDEVALNTASRHDHANKPALDGCTASFTVEQADDITANNTHRAITDGNPHGITPIMIGAETPADAQIKANIAEANAIAYANAHFTKSPGAPLFSVPMRNSFNMVQGVGLIAFSRASTATYLDRYGILRHVDIDEPRFGKDGLLIEGSSINYFVGSTDVSVFDTFTNCSKSLNQQYDANYEITTDIVTIDLPGVPWQISKIIDTVYLEKGKYYTFSVRLRSNQNINMEIKLRDSSGANSGDFGGTKLVTLDERLVRYEFTVFVPEATIGHPEVILAPTTTLDGSSFAIVDMQLEELNFASSVIPTTTVPVTRAADNVSFNYRENFPGSLVDKTVIIDVNVFGTTTDNSMCFNSGDLQLYISDGTPGNRKVKASMSSFSTTEFVEKLGKFRIGVSYNRTLETLSMYHDGVLVSEDTTATIADPPLSDPANIEAFFSEVYDGLDPSYTGPIIIQHPLEVFNTIVSLSTNSPYCYISNLLIYDEALSPEQHKVA